MAQDVGPNACACVQVVPELSEAVSMLYENHLLPHLPDAAQLPPNTFRLRMYCEVR